MATTTVEILKNVPIPPSRRMVYDPLYSLEVRKVPVGPKVAAAVEQSTLRREVFVGGGGAERRDPPVPPPLKAKPDPMRDPEIRKQYLADRYGLPTPGFLPTSYCDQPSWSDGEMKEFREWCADREGCAKVWAEWREVQKALRQIRDPEERKRLAERRGWFVGSNGCYQKRKAARGAAS